MSKNVLKKTIFIIAIVVVCLWGLIGGWPPPTSLRAIRQNIEQGIHLGLDLRGGTHLVLQVMVNDAINSESDQAIERLKESFKQKQIKYDAINRVDAVGLYDDGGIQIQGIPDEQTGAFRQALDEGEVNWTYSQTQPRNYQLTLKKPVSADIRNRTLDQSLETIRNRIDSLGVSEPTIQERGQGEFEILVQLPGVDDPVRVKELVQTTAMLEIKEVKDGPYPSREQTLTAGGGVLPPGTEALELINRAESGGAPTSEWYVLTRVPAVSGRDLRSARAGRDENQRPEVEFTLTADGARRFGDFTERNVGNRLAVVLDGKVQEVATIQSKITDSGRITGRYTPQRASDIALVLRAGALPASMRYLEERTVGPSLGADSIRDGIVASMVGLAAVIIFMVIYYRMAGVNAIVALFLNLILLLAALAYIRATLTLPGIAGVILTIGMAVDANVLVFERVREELRAGKTVVSSVEAGFSKAFLTIIDTHVATIISAFFLFLFGTGPVKGFAVTLSIGLVANVFTAVFVSRVIFDYVLSRKERGTALSI